VPVEPFEAIAGVLRVVRVSTKYRLIGRHDGGTASVGFTYNGVRFDDASVNVFAGLCAVDSRESVDAMLAALAAEGVVTTRMGAYKPRTSPYDFQGLGRECLPYVFELAGKHGVRVVAMEITDARHIDEVQKALAAAGDPTGVMLQIGTRNVQNFELLKAVGQQQRFPVLFKRGMGITLEESLNACEYIASEGNPNVVFCLRGVKTHLGDPHRNLVDFGHVPVVRRQTRLPVCVDPSHSVGRLDPAPDGLSDIFHVTGQGLIAGASMVLIDFHPRPEVALCDGPQALRLEQLPRFLEYVRKVRAAYESLL
jgi:3-deoxy-7-phosphoheptulonate synthase